MAAGTKCCAVQPFFLPRRPYTLEGKTQRNNITKTCKNQEIIHNGAVRNMRGVTRNFEKINDLRNKILSFRDLLDMSPCTSSSSLKELLVLTLKDLNKSYPNIKSIIPISELKSALPIQILICFCAFLKSLGDSWTDNAGWRAKYNNDVFYKPDQYDMEKLAFALLDDMIKLAKERIFDTMEEEQNLKDSLTPFGKVLSEESLLETSRTSLSTSPRTPTSVLPVMKYESSSSSSSKKVSSTSSFLFPLRVQSIEKLNPIDLKRLSCNIVKKDDDGIKNVDHEEYLDFEMEDDTMDTETNRVETQQKLFRLRSNVTEYCLGEEFDVVQPPLKLPRLRSTPMDLNSFGRILDSDVITEEPVVNVVEPVGKPKNTYPITPPMTSSNGLALGEVSALTGILGSNVNVKELVVTVKEPVGKPKTTLPPLLPVTSSNTLALAEVSALSGILGSTLGPNVTAEKLVVTMKEPVGKPKPKTTLPPPTNSGTITTLQAPPPPPPPQRPVGAIDIAPPLPPSPPGASHGVGAPPPPPKPMGSGGPPPPPPGPGGAKNLRAKKALTKLRRSAQMGTLYRFLKGKVEGNSLEGKSSKKGKIGAAAAGGKQSMADALAEMTKRSAYFQQIEEDVKNHANTIKELKVAINSFETSDMAELLKFHKHVESQLEKLTDETQVLARFEDFPTKKLEALRMAAALFSKLDNIATTLKSWHIEPPVHQQLVKVENYFNKIKEELDALERTKDEESKKFQGQKINFDFSILIRIKEQLVDISSSCMELALKERREANEKEKATKTDGKKKVSGKILWKAFQFAYRVYTFAGGQDDRADTLTRELAREIEIDPDN